ncbi:hypothetical protein OsI_12138 [Oryza sativa Indica Group]|uniref:Uncharacterized protein n=1 Tax=Oryza sativa subsp. indica TaxID=39946 RepID=A2XI76_ORYSI|nr:hypothetical protein OsI_12138 [Oryza sativa Indica Group]
MREQRGGGGLGPAVRDSARRQRPRECADAFSQDGGCHVEGQPAPALRRSTTSDRDSSMQSPVRSPATAATAMDAVDSVVDSLREFAKDSICLVKHCHKPDRKEFTKVVACMLQKYQTH